MTGSNDRMWHAELISVLGEDATVALAEEFAGNRLYVPRRIRDNHRITRAIGREAADKLCAHYSPTTLRIPVLRELRAQHLRAKGWPSGKIATHLGMTQTGVTKLFQRVSSAQNLSNLDTK